jgi:hypothetical protein
MNRVLVVALLALLVMHVSAVDTEVDQVAEQGIHFFGFSL